MNALSWINAKIMISSSRIDLGKNGLFAIEKINKGETLIVQSGKIISDDHIDDHPYDKLEDVCFQICKGFHICPQNISNLEGAFLINHSCEPNCGVSGNIEFLSMREIQAGEEITIDYAMTDADYEGIPYQKMAPMDCNCGSSQCRKIITCDDWKNPNIQEKYRGFFSLYIEKMIHDR